MTKKKGRPEVYNAEYFPHKTKSTKELELLVHRHKSCGYMAYYKLQELLADSDFHYISLKTQDDQDMFDMGMEVSKEVVDDLISILINAGHIDKQLFEKKQLIYWDGFVNSLRPLWHNRGLSRPQKDDINRISNNKYSFDIRRNLQERKVSKQKKENEKKENKGDIVITPNISSIYQEFMEKDDVQPNQSIAKLIQCAIDNHGAQQVYDATDRYHMDDKEIKIKWFFMNDYQDYLTGSWESFDPH